MDERSEQKQFTTKRQPAEETVDLYSGLCVHDDRVSGSITASRSRLPLWAFVGTIVTDGWETVVSEEEGWPYLEEEYGWTRQKMSDFFYYLMQSRGEFGRLTLLMAEMNRLGEAASAPWIAEANNRERMKEQLQRCLEALED